MLYDNVHVEFANILGSKMLNIRDMSALIFLTLSVTACSSNTEENVAVGIPAMQPATFARFVPERADDFAWENDLIAFRAYGPAARDKSENAGVDCWLKRVDYPIINRWYINALEKGKSYHQDHGEGLDNYHVGSSAGCGSTSLWLNGKREPLETFTTWEIISSTQDKTVFVLTYENQIDGHVYAEHKKISIEMGKRLYSTQSTFKKDGVIARSLPVAVGLTTHDEKATPSWDTDQGWLMTWEVLDDKGLGTAVLVDPDRIQSVEVVESKGVKDMGHALLIVNTDENGQVIYQSGYGWEGAGEITSPAKWQSYLIKASSK